MDFGGAYSSGSVQDSHLIPFSSRSRSDWESRNQNSGKDKKNLCPYKKRIKKQIHGRIALDWRTCFRIVYLHGTARLLVMPVEVAIPTAGNDPIWRDGILSMILYSMKLLILFAGLSGVWSDNTSDLTMCSVPCLYFWKCSEAMCDLYASWLA